MKKHKRLSEHVDEEGNVSEYYSDSSKVYISSHLPPRWWLHPVFDFGLKYPMPYIWFMYWLITWEEVTETSLGDVLQFGWYHRKQNGRWFYTIPSHNGLRFIKVSISFMPD